MPDLAAAPPEFQRLARQGRLFVRARLDDPDGGFGLVTVPDPVAGRYRPDRVLAVGELTFLLHARDLRTGRPVVIKAVRSDRLAPPPGLSDPEPVLAAVRHARHLLQTERRLTVRLRNAGCNNVAAPVDYVHDSNPDLNALGLPVDPRLAASEPYLVLAYIPGTPLDEFLRREHPRGLDPARALSIMRPVVRTLARLQRPWRQDNGRTWVCLYQDLKPANLLIDPTGRLHLVDLGGCQVLVDGVPVLSGCLTDGYAPPEAVSDGPARVLQPTADVYTIGATLHHLLTGRDPRDTPHHPGRPQARSPLPATCPPAVRRLVDRCLAHRPSDRFPNAAKAADAIAACLSEAEEAAS